MCHFTDYRNTINHNSYLPWLFKPWQVAVMVYALVKCYGLCFGQMKYALQTNMYANLVYLTLLPETAWDTRSISKSSKAGLNSEFSISETGCLTKAKEHSLLYYFPIAKFISFSLWVYVCVCVCVHVLAISLSIDEVSSKNSKPFSERRAIT